jgi:Flp pilus assembly pilin Flp
MRDRESFFFQKEYAMKSISRKFMQFVRDEQGTETLEWGLICGLIVIVGIVAIGSIGPKVKKMWDATDTAVPAGPISP